MARKKKKEKILSMDQGQVCDHKVGFAYSGINKFKCMCILCHLILCKHTVHICTFMLTDVASWREGGGRGAMQQQQNKPDSPSSPTGLTSQGQTETQQNGPQTSSPVELPSQPPRPGSGPTSGGPMPMGPPMGMPPQYRMMPPYVSLLICHIILMVFAMHCCPFMQKK